MINWFLQYETGSIKAAESDKKNLILKCTNTEAETQRLIAENKVLEAALKSVYWFKFSLFIKIKISYSCLLFLVGF